MCIILPSTSTYFKHLFFFQVSSPKFCKHFSYFSCVPYAQPISLPLIWSPEKYLVSSYNKGPHYTIFSSVLLLTSPWTQYVPQYHVIEHPLVNFMIKNIPQHKCLSHCINWASFYTTHQAAIHGPRGTLKNDAEVSHCTRRWIKNWDKVRSAVRSSGHSFFVATVCSILNEVVENWTVTRNSKFKHANFYTLTKEKRFHLRYQQDRQRAYNVTMSHVCFTIPAVEKK